MRSVRSSRARVLLGALSLFAVWACEPAPPAGGPAASASAVASAPASSRPPDDAARFTETSNAILDEMLADRPAMGRLLGLHQHDGKIADYSSGGLARRLAHLHAARTKLDVFSADKLSPDAALDLALLRQAIDETLFHEEELAEPKARPQFFGELFEVNVYLDRDYAPLPERAQRLLAHEKLALAALPGALDNLAGPFSRPVLETAKKIFDGYAEYLRGDVAKILKGVGDDAFQADFAKTNAELAKAAEGVATKIKTELMPKSDDITHILGKERYEKLLFVQEGLKTPIEELRKMGEDDLAANKAAFLDLSKKTKLVRPKATELLDVATKVMDGARQFLVDKKIVSIPGEDRAILKESPPYMRWNSAFLDSSGPFDDYKLAFYYVTMPDPTWPKKEQEEYVMARGIILSTTVHEVWPGHFLQSQWIRRAPTRTQKMLGSYSFVEGWAHYVEQMMIEEGYGAEDPQNHLGQLSDALLRNCRVVVSIGLHVDKMPLAAAEKRFMDDCMQDKATAHEQAVRGTFDPGYFAYTLGKLQILKLRDEAKKALGAKFDLRAFHDALLAHGSPPVPLVRDRVLADLGAKK